MKKKILVLSKGDKKSEIVEKEISERKIEDNTFNSQIVNSAGIGFSIALPIVGGAVLGSYLDKQFSTSPYLMLGMLLVGVVVGVSSIYFLLKDK